jgi:hypothetical protein
MNFYFLIYRWNVKKYQNWKWFIKILLEKYVAFSDKIKYWFCQRFKIHDSYFGTVDYGIFLRAIFLEVRYHLSYGRREKLTCYSKMVPFMKNNLKLLKCVSWIQKTTFKIFEFPGKFSKHPSKHPRRAPSKLHLLWNNSGMKRN